MLEFTGLAGGRVRFEVEKVRNFVPEKDVETALDEMQKEFLKPGLAYLCSPRFAEAFITKRFEEMKRERSLAILHREVMDKVRATEGEPGP